MLLFYYEIISLCSAIRHGDRVALQTFVRDQWLSCAAEQCGRSDCPKFVFDKSDFSQCYGEVFEIYRQKGPGKVRVGDQVGLHYPREKGKWLGCPSDTCDKRDCPGIPTRRHGFQDKDKWFQCSAERFEIYAGNKKNGAVIRAYDDISLYVVNEYTWVSQGLDKTVKSSCLGTSRPPANGNYDGCSNEVFNIVKRA